MPTCRRQSTPASAAASGAAHKRADCGGTGVGGGRAAATRRHRARRERCWLRSALRSSAGAYGMSAARARAPSGGWSRKSPRLSTHDGMTGLPNGRFFTEWLTYAIANARREQGHVGVLFIDVNGCAAVGEYHGERAADALLVEVARRFRAASREGDLFARLAPTEFALATPNARDGRELALLAQRLRDQLNDPALPPLADTPIGASIGIAYFPEDANDSAGHHGSGQRRDVRGAARRQESHRVQRAGCVTPPRGNRAGHRRARPSRRRRVQNIRTARRPCCAATSAVASRAGASRRCHARAARQHRFPRRDTQAPGGSRRSASTASRGSIAYRSRNRRDLVDEACGEHRVEPVRDRRVQRARGQPARAQWRSSGPMSLVGFARALQRRERRARSARAPRARAGCAAHRWAPVRAAVAGSTRASSACSAGQPSRAARASSAARTAGSAARQTRSVLRATP